MLNRVISPRWRKVQRDLWSNRARTLLVVASIAVGIFAVGVVQHIRTVVLDEMQAVYDQSNAAHATIYAGGVDDEMLEVIRRVPGVSEAEGRSLVSVNVNVATPGEPELWESISLTAVDDFTEARVNLLVPQLDDNRAFNAESSSSFLRWPEKDELVIERSAFQSAGALPEGLAVGDTLQVETSEGKARTLTLTGSVHDANMMPASFSGSASGYIDMETAERLGGSRDYSIVYVRVEGDRTQIMDEGYVEGIADDVADKIEKGGLAVQRVQVFSPGELPLQSLFDSITLVLTPLGILALILGSLLVVNTLSALMSQQTRQIGVMKSVGADNGQIIVMYICMVLMYSLLAIAVAIPLTVVTASAIEGFLGDFVNVTMPTFVLPNDVLWIQIAIGFLVPILASLIPIIKGTAVTVREAISDYGVGEGEFGTAWTDRLISRIRGLSRPVQISLRNTFRKRARLILTLITLVLGGMLFMTIGSVRSSLESRVESALAYNQFDLQIQFERDYRTAKIEQAVWSIPDVTNVEAWTSGSATRIRADDSESAPITLTALPPESEMVQPTLAEGRWLYTEDENAIVLSQSIISDETDILVGDTIILDINGKEQPWVVVGFAETTDFRGGSSAYVVYDYYTRLTSSVGSASTVLVTIDRETLMGIQGLSIDNVVTAFEETLDARGLNIANIDTVDRIRAFTGNFFDVIVSLLLIMGVLIASVGALGLAGTMSTNVMERTREIGVMRSIGASNGAILRIVLIEGILIGVLSWVFGAMLAFPAGYALSSALGLALFQQPLAFIFSADGVYTWLAIVIVLAGVASFLPARSASKITVRAALAYE